MLFDFIKDNYVLILNILLALIILVLNLVKKRPVLNKDLEIYNYILRTLPSLINSCEKPGNGPLKKEFVMNEVKLLIAKEFNFYDWEFIQSFVSAAIEDILSTPEKK